MCSEPTNGKSPPSPQNSPKWDLNSNAAPRSSGPNGGIPIISPKAHYFIARKTLLVRPKEFSDRFTYQVQLERKDDAHADGPPGTEHWVVRKEVPHFEDSSLAALPVPNLAAQPHPGLRSAPGQRKFADQIFPLFLTREAAMLKIIERDCPREFIHRFPRVIDLEKDDNGYVKLMRLQLATELRQGKTLSAG